MQSNVAALSLGLLLIGVFAGYFFGYMVYQPQIDYLKEQYNNIESQIQNLESQLQSLQNIIAELEASEEEKSENNTTFTATEQLLIVNIEFCTGTPNYINCTVLNTGTSAVTISSAYVNEASVTISGDTTLSANEAAELKLTGTAAQWINGNTYEVKLLSTNGNAFIITVTAPS